MFWGSFYPGSPGYFFDLPTVSAPDMIWTRATLAFDLTSLTAGGPSDAGDLAP